MVCVGSDIDQTMHGGRLNLNHIGQISRLFFFFFLVCLLLNCILTCIVLVKLLVQFHWRSPTKHRKKTFCNCCNLEKYVYGFWICSNDILDQLVCIFIAYTPQPTNISVIIDTILVYENESNLYTNISLICTSLKNLNACIKLVYCSTWTDSACNIILFIFSTQMNEHVYFSSILIFINWLLHFLILFACFHEYWCLFPRHSCKILEGLKVLLFISTNFKKRSNGKFVM
jgi:hypothetical protein